MALSPVKTFGAEVLTFSDLNSMNTNILNNALSLISPLTGNLATGGFILTGLGAGAALADSATLRQVQYNFGAFLTSVAGTNTITGTATPTPAYTVGQLFTFIPAVTNTGATTLNISSVGAGAVQLAGAALTGGELVASVPVTVYVSATTPVFEIIAPTQFPDSRALVVGATDSTKKVRFEADGITTGTTRVVTVPDRNLTIGPTLGTEQASTSGTSIDFTGIPAGVKRITVMFKAVSTNGTSPVFVRIGDSGGIETSGYDSGVFNAAGGGTVQDGSAAGFQIVTAAVAAAIMNGTVVLSLENAASFSWTSYGAVAVGATTSPHVSSGVMSLTGELTQLSITMENGTDAFDAGAININYE